MSDMSVPSPIGHDTYVCNGFRAINGVFRHRGELFDATGVRNMDILEEMGLVRRTVPELPTINVEYDGLTRRFVNDEYANLFIEWTAKQDDEVQEAAPAVAEAGEPADDDDSNEGDEGEGEEEAIDYESLTKAQLAELLDEREIEYKASDNKPKMIALLVANDEEGDTEEEEEEEEDGDEQP